MPYSDLISKLRKQNISKEQKYTLKTTILAGKRSGKITDFKTVGTIREALHIAKEEEADIAEVYVQHGIFKGTVIIDRPTRIIGPDCNGRGAMIDGAILNDKGHYLVVRNIQISGGANFGILQKGGILDVNNVLFNPTVRSINRSIGMPILHISNGAQAIIEALKWVGNYSSAVCVMGEGTKVVVSGLNISGFKFALGFIETCPFPATGVIEVGDRATLLAENCILTNNEYVSVYVHDGGQMHFRGGTIDGTKSVETSHGSIGGHNFLFMSGAKAELRNFISSNAVIGIALQDAYLTAENGTVSGNLVGIHLEPPADYNPSNCIYDNVQFMNNESKVSGYIPIPVLNPDRSNCPIIAWE